jgi:hypothetical protein
MLIVINCTIVLDENARLFCHDFISYQNYKVIWSHKGFEFGYQAI